MLRPCVRGARGPFGGFGPLPGVVSLPFPPSRPACPVLRVAGCPIRVSLALARWYAIPPGLCVPRARSGCPSGSPRVPFACVCARAPAASAPPPWVVWVAHLARSRHWALVGPFHVVRSPPRVLPQSLAPSGVLGGGAGRSRFPPTWLGVVGVAEGHPRGGCLPLLRGASGVRRSASSDCPPTGRAVGVRHPRAVGAGVRVWGPYSVPLVCTPCGGCVPRGGSVAFLCRGAGWGGWGGLRRAPPLCGRGGGSLCLVPSLCLPWAGNKAGVTDVVLLMGGGGPPYHSGSCSPAFTGRSLCGVLARWRGLVCSPWFLWEPAAGAGGRAALRLLPRAGGVGTIPPAFGGSGPGPLRLAGRLGGWGGGGARRGLPAPPLGGGPRYPIPAPLVPSVHSPPACGCGRGRGAAPGWGGMRGGPWTAPPGAPADLNPPSALPEWAVVMGGSCGAQPPYCSGAQPCAAPKLGPRVAPARWCGLALWPRPSREQAAGGAGARGVQVQPHPPPPRRGPFWGRGGAPSALGGRRVAAVAPKLGGGRGGGGLGGPPPRPPAMLGVGLPFVASGVPARGILMPSGLPGGRGRRTRSGRPPTGQCGGGGGGGGGGGNSPALVHAPVFPGPASERAALFAPSWAPPARRRPAAGRACGRLPRPWCPRTPGAAASSGGVRGCRFFGLPPSALGPEWEGGGGGGGGPLVPWRRLLTAEGGAAWRSRPRGPAVGWGVGPSCRPSLGPLVPPAVVARRWPAGGGREG